MTNPNNCDTCDYKAMKGSEHDPKQHCYMFYDTPNEQCMQHTGHRKEDLKFNDLLRSLLPKHTKGTS
jgi:hypothetical protein